MRYFVRIAFAAVLGLIACHALCQSTSSLSGYVLDPSKAAIPGAHVAITNPSTGFNRSVVTSGQGRYSFFGLTPGVYSVAVHADGFKATEQTGITVAVDKQVSANLVLELGPSIETVTVSAPTVELETDSGHRGTTIGATEIDGLGVNGRDFAQLTTLVPGVYGNVSDSVGNINVKSVMVNANYGWATSWSVDNAQDLEPKSSQNLETNPAMAAIGEFNVETSSFSAAYGSAGAAVVNVSIQNGTNQFHGQAYEWFRNSALNARNYFSTTVPPQKRNDFGFTLGGPIKRNKVFFFYSEELRRYIDNSSIATHTPSEAELHGDFSHSPFANNAHSLIDPTGRGCVVGAQVSTSCFDPNAVAVLNTGLFPSANASSFTNYIATPAYASNLHQELVRLDYDVTPKTALMGHYIHEGDVVASPVASTGGQSFPTIGSSNAVPSYNALIRITHTASPNFVSTSDLTYGRWGQHLTATGNYTTPAGFNVPLLFSSANTGNRIPSLSFSQGYGGIGIGSTPSISTTQTFHAQENVTLVRGLHTVNFGGLWQEARSFKQVTSNPSTPGQFSFTGAFTNNSFADFLLGYDATFSQLSAQLASDLRQKMFASFVQDDLHLNKRLTLNLGLRWTVMPHAFDAGNLASNFLPSLWDPAQAPQLTSSGNIVPGTGNLLNGILVANGKGFSRSFITSSWNVFDPRLGFAFIVPHFEKLVVRGGYGMFHYNDPEDDSFNMITNPPFASAVTIQNSTLADPSAGISPASAPRSLTTRDTTYKVSTVQEYNLGLQLGLPNKVLLDASYVGSDSTHGQAYNNINTPLPVPGYDFDPALNTSSAQINLYRPYRGFGSINQSVNEVIQNYNSLQVSLRRGLANGYYYGVSYTLGKCLGDNLGNNPQNNYRRIDDYGYCSYDQSQVLKAYFLGRISIFRNSHSLLSKTLGGWSVSGIVTAYTGTAANIGITGGNLGLATRPNLGRPVKYVKKQSQWLSGDFTKPLPGFYGNSRAYGVHGPGLQQWDLSLLKPFAFTERISARLRCDAFNVLNHTNFSGFSSSYGSGNFGQTTSAAIPRNLQLGLQVFF